MQSQVFGWNNRKWGTQERKSESKLLNAAVTKIWNEIDQTQVNSLIDSMPDRLEKCIAANGEKIDVWKLFYLTY